MKKDTVMRIKITTKERLKKLKIHPRQSYDEVINIILDKIEKSTAMS